MEVLENTLSQFQQEWDCANWPSLSQEIDENLDGWKTLQGHAQWAATYTPTGYGLPHLVTLEVVVTDIDDDNNIVTESINTDEFVKMFSE